MWIDIALLIIMGAGVLYGYNKGLIQTVYAIVGIVVGMIVILKLSPILIQFLGDTFSIGPVLTFFIGIALSIVLVLIISKFIGKFINKATKTPVINTVNKSLGAILLGLFFTTAFSFILWFLIGSGVVKLSTTKQSMTYPYLEELPKTAKGAVKSVQPLFRGLVKEARDAFRDFKDSEEKQKEKWEKNK